MEYLCRAVAVVRSGRVDLVDDDWGEVEARLELLEDVPASSLTGLEDFSHVEIVFLASRARDVPPAPWRRRPRGNPAWPEVGVFAQRNKDRPNRLLVSVAALVRVEPRALVVRGLDALDDTPVLDIKPVFRWGGARGALRVADWSEELGARYY